MATASLLAPCVASARQWAPVGAHWQTGSAIPAWLYQLSSKYIWQLTLLYTAQNIQNDINVTQARFREINLTPMIVWIWSQLKLRPIDVIS